MVQEPMATPAPAVQMSEEEKKQKALVDYRRRLLEKKELQAKVKQRTDFPIHR